VAVALSRTRCRLWESVPYILVVEGCLIDFVKYLDKSSQCIVDETEKVRTSPINKITPVGSGRVSR
jgi:hypothetical protein